MKKIYRFGGKKNEYVKTFIYRIFIGLVFTGITACNSNTNSRLQWEKYRHIKALKNLQQAYDNLNNTDQRYFLEQLLKQVENSYSVTLQNGVHYPCIADTKYDISIVCTSSLVTRVMTTYN